VAGAWSALVAPSRVALLAPWPSDVVGAWLFAAIAKAVLIALYSRVGTARAADRLAGWHRRRSGPVEQTQCAERDGADGHGQPKGK
jgi:membrane-associated phospholipid phosphatase